MSQIVADESVDSLRRHEIILERNAQMKKLDRYERGILSAYDKGALVSARPTNAAPVSGKKKRGHSNFLLPDEHGPR